MKFKAEDDFKHQSVLVYLMLYYQEDIFQFQLQILDEKGRQLLVLH